MQYGARGAPDTGVVRERRSPPASKAAARLMFAGTTRGSPSSSMVTVGLAASSGLNNASGMSRGLLESVGRERVQVRRLALARDPARNVVRMHRRERDPAVAGRKVCAGTARRLLVNRET